MNLIHFDLEKIENMPKRQRMLEYNTTKLNTKHKYAHSIYYRKSKYRHIAFNRMFHYIGRPIHDVYVSLKDELPKNGSEDYVAFWLVNPKNTADNRWITRGMYFYIDENNLLAYQDELNPKKKVEPERWYHRKLQQMKQRERLNRKDVEIKFVYSYDTSLGRFAKSIYYDYSTTTHELAYIEPKLLEEEHNNSEGKWFKKYYKERITKCKAKIASLVIEIEKLNNGDLSSYYKSWEYKSTKNPKECHHFESSFKQLKEI